MFLIFFIFAGIEAFFFDLALVLEEFAFFMVYYYYLTAVFIERVIIYNIYLEINLSIEIIVIPNDSAFFTFDERELPFVTK